MSKIAFVLFTLVVVAFVAGFIDPQIWPTGSQVPMIEKMTPGEIVKTNGKTVDHISEHLLKGSIFSINVIESKDPTEVSQDFHRVDWKKQKYWLNMDQYKEYRRLRTIDFLWLLMSSFAAGLLLLAGIIWKNEWWGLFLKLIAYEIIWIVFAYFRNPTWWFMHPVWEISTALYVICGFFATIQLLLYTEPDPVFRSKTIYYSEPVPQPW